MSSAKDSLLNEANTLELGEINTEKEGLVSGVSVEKPSTTSSASTSSSSTSSSSSSSSSFLATSGWICSSICTSVGIILVNKFLMKAFDFKWIFTLTSLHLLVTFVGMEVLALCGYFKRQWMPLSDSIVVGGFAIGSIACMNFSLKLNSVGFYQVLKLLCIPCMVVIQSTFYNTKFSGKIKAILVVVLLGVGIATVSDMQLNTNGCIMGALAVVFTAQFQIWQGEKQRQYKMNAMQINHSQALPSFAWCAILAYIYDFMDEDAVTKHEFQDSEGMWIFLSCVLALTVNLSSYGLIGATSPVTYQVVGHAKTCLVLLGGFYMYPVSDTNALLKNLLGIVIAMFGVIVYGHLKMMDGKTPRPQDWCDMYLPQFLLRAIN